MKSVILPPIKERVEDYEAIEAVIARFFRIEIYGPLLKAIGESEKSLTAIKNSSDPRSQEFKDREALSQAIQSGQIRFYRGRFQGKFSSRLSRALRSIGAEWDRKQGSFVVPQSKLPREIRQAVAVSEYRFQKTAEKINEKLAAISPAELAQKLDLTILFDHTIYKVEKDIAKTLKGITIEPQLSPEGRARIAAEYTKNLQIPIQDFIAKETEELRKRITEKAFAGHRYETMVAEIQKSYGVSQRKAKFLARQETSLLMTKFKQVRYQEAGSDEYIWGCVADSANHPVRHYHLLNKGKKFKWSEGAPINAADERKNPGQDYNCRCFAKPIVRF